MLRPQVKTFFFLSLFFLSIGIFAQNSDRESSSSSKSKGAPAQHEIRGNMEKLMESFGMKKEDFEEINKKAGGDPQKMMQLMRQKMKERQGSGKAQAGGSSRSVSAKDFLAGNAEEAVRKLILPFSRMSESRVIELLKQEKTKERARLSKFDSFLSSPKSIRFFARLLRDQKALPKLASILDNRRKLLYFAGANIALFILTFYLKRRHRLKHPGMGLIGSLFHWAFRFIFMSAVRLAVAFAFFKSQFAPAWSIFEKTYFN